MPGKMTSVTCKVPMITVARSGRPLDGGVGEVVVKSGAKDPSCRHWRRTSRGTRRGAPDGSPERCFGGGSWRPMSASFAGAEQKLRFWRRAPALPYAP